MQNPQYQIILFAPANVAEWAGIIYYSEFVQDTPGKCLQGPMMRPRLACLPERYHVVLRHPGFRRRALIHMPTDCKDSQGFKIAAALRS